jgi:hypothetical protein
MADNDIVLQELGKLSGLMQATREDVKQVSNTQREQGESINTLTTSFNIMQECYKYTNKELTQVNEKLSRDYERINVLEKDKTVNNGIDAYKEKKRIWWQWTLGIIGVMIGILISINQLVSIGHKINFGEQAKVSSSVYAAPLDTLKDTTMFTVETDTIKGGL